MTSAISNMIKKIWTPVLVLIVVTLAFMVALNYGIQIDKISIGNIDIERLYIKLDKKLIVEIGKASLSKSSGSDNAREEFVKVLGYLPWLNRLFEAVSIGSLKYDNESIKFVYKHDIFYLDSDYMTIDATISADKSDTTIQIKQLLLKDFNLELKGVLDFNILSEKGFFEGSFQTYEIEGNMALRLENRLLSYVAKTDTFTSLDSFMKALEKSVNVESEISEWVYQRITGKAYMLHYLKGKIDLENGNFFPYEMEGDATVKEVAVKYNDDLPPATIETLKVTLKNNQLLFDLGHSLYEGIDISRSNIYIYNLFTQKGGIVVTIDANTPLDERIHNILKAYDIKIPLTQTSGKTRAKLQLDIEFLPFNLDATGTFIVQNSDFTLLGEPFFTNHALVTLDNYSVYLDNTNFRYRDIIEFSTQGVLDLENQTYFGNADIDYLHINHEGKTIVNLEEEITPVLLDLQENIKISLPEYKTFFEFSSQKNSFILKDLSRWCSLIPLLKDYEIESGSAKIDTLDFENFNIFLAATSIKTPLYRNDKSIKNLDLNIVVDKKGVYVTGDGISIKQTKDTNTILLNDIDIEVNEQTKSSDVDVLGSFALEGNRSALLFEAGKRSFVFENYNINKSINILTLKGKLAQGGLANLKKDNNHFELNLEQLSSSSFNDVIEKKFFNEGVFDILLKGSDVTYFSGNIHLKDSYLIQMQAYNNLIALLNTIPSLALFKAPGFDEKGYRISDGNILFSRKGDILTFHAIELKGVSADITGKGFLNLNENTLHIDLRLKTLKDVSGLIGKIPLINHIFLGKDNSIATSVTISGNLQNPDVKTQVLQDVILTPFNILKRTIELPFKLFSD